MNMKMTTVRKSVVCCDSVNTGFVGFIICLKNLHNLAKYLIDHNIVDYFLSYKLSQDHVEMFFSCIRRMNGHNNNPTTTQYKSAYKKLLFHKLNIIMSSSANCTPLDQTLLFSEEMKEEKIINSNVKISTINSIDRTAAANKMKIVIPKLHQLSNNQINDLSQNNYHNFEHNYSKCEYWCYSEYADEIIKHTAGAIVRILKRKIHCNKCCDLLDGTNSDFKSKLTLLKNRGSLCFASDDVNFICKCTEKIIRQQENFLHVNIDLKLITKTMKILPSSILNDEHFQEQEFLLNHRNQLIVLIIQTYLDIRLKHEGTILQDKKQRIRMQNNKITIFSGQ